MPKKIVWDETGKRFYEAGVSKGVLYVEKENTQTKVVDPYGLGVPWNGLIGVTEKPTGAEPNDMWADGMKYASIRSAENYESTIEAYTYPDEFAACDGSVEVIPGVFIGQQKRKPFGMCYRTEIGNDLSESVDAGYKLHLVYGASASVSEREYTTLNDSPEGMTLSWDVSTTPVVVEGYKPTATLTIDSRKFTTEQMAKLEEILYGSDTADARLPLPKEVFTLMKTTAEQTSAE